MSIIRFLVLVGTLLGLTLAANGAPITASVISIPQPPIEPLQILVVNGPAGVERHYLAWNAPSADAIQVLAAQTGRVVARLEYNFDYVRYYVLDSLSGPGEYGDANQQSPAVDKYNLNPGGETEFTDYIFKRYGLPYYSYNNRNFLSFPTGMDKHGNIYGYNLYGDVSGWVSDDKWLDVGEVTVTWKNFSPYPIPEPSTTVLVSLGLGAALMARGLRKSRQP